MQPQLASKHSAERLQQLQRPRTAVAASTSSGGGTTPKKMLSLQTQHDHLKRASSLQRSPDSALSVGGKYLREFPKPQPGVIKLNAVDENQRLAWMS
jgi:hypothetical protein